MSNAINPNGRLLYTVNPAILGLYDSTDKPVTLETTLIYGKPSNRMTARTKTDLSFSVLLGGKRVSFWNFACITFQNYIRENSTKATKRGVKLKETEEAKHNTV